MARIAKLTSTQCAHARNLRSEKHIPVIRLANKFKVSESSMYKVLDGSYQARRDNRQRKLAAAVKPRDTNTLVTPTPNLFPDLPATAALGTEVGDDVLLEAARLIVARSRFANLLRN